MKRAVLVAALAAAALGCRGKQDPSLIVATGHVEATDVHVSTKVAGRLESFPLEEGDAVSAGQEIARVDTTDLRLALRQAQAERAQAAADLRLKLRGARPEDVEEMEAQVRSAEAEAAGAQRDLERLQDLLDRGSGTAKARDDARTRRDVTAARLAGLRQALARLRNGFREEEKDASRARVAAVEARIAQLQQQVEDAVIVSPGAGVVTEKVAEAGELLAANAPVCVITDLADAWLSAYVAETDLGRIRLGQEAEVVTDAGQARRGTLTFVSSRAEFTPKNVQTRDERVKLVYRIKVTLANEDGLFKPGMPAEARLRAVEAGR